MSNPKGKKTVGVLVSKESGLGAPELREAVGELYRLFDEGFPVIAQAESVEKVKDFFKKKLSGMNLRNIQMIYEEVAYHD